MTTAGPNNPTSATSNGIVGSVAWGSPTNIFSQNGTYSGFDAESSGDSERLDASGFGHSVPGGATIDGIQFDWYIREASSSDNIFDKSAFPLKAGTAVGTDQKSATEWPSAFGYRTYGGPTSLMGTTWTPSDVNNSGFGFGLQAAESVGNNINAEGRVDHVRSYVYYTTAAGSFFSVSSCSGIGCTGPKNFARGNE